MAYGYTLEHPTSDAAESMSTVALGHFPDIMLSFENTVICKSAPDKNLMCPVLNIHGVFA